MIKAIFFDFDGVLTKDKKGSINVCNNLAELTGIPFRELIDAYNYKKQEYNRGTISKEEFWVHFCNRLGKKLDIGLLDDAFTKINVNWPVFNLSQELREKYKIGIISNNPRERFEQNSRDMQLERKFDGLFISFMFKSLKPDRRIFERATEEFGCRADECVFIDNNREKLGVPREMGFHTIYFDEEKNDIEGLERELIEAGVEIQ